MKLAFYEILWTDSATDTGWDSAESAKPPQKLLKSYGYLIRQNEEYITIAADYDEESKNFNRFLHIPLVNIKKKRKVKI